MRVIGAHHVADDLGGLAIRFVGRVAALVHAVHDAAMHRFQAIACVGQRAADDDGHGVGEVGALHLLLEGHRLGVAWARVFWVVGGVAQNMLCLGSLSRVLLQRLVANAKPGGEGFVPF